MIFFLKAPDVCQFYPITSYQLKFNYETPNVQTNTSITITDSVVSNDNYVTLTSPQLESDRNYAASLTAANEVDSTNAQYIEFGKHQQTNISVLLAFFPK